MEEQKKSTFPMLPAIHWWSLRNKFQKGIPKTLSDTSLSTVLKTKPDSVRVNVLPYLKAIGFIDEKGNVLDKSSEWIDDAKYAAVCARIVEAIYPKDLTDSIPNPAKDRKAVEAWFSERTKAGTSAVKRMASFYTLLAEADLSKKRERPAGSAKKSGGTERAEASVKERKGKGKPGREKSPAPAPTPEPMPVNLNIQIHIPADATAEQIQEIFRNMGKYLYRKLKG
jgi:hypothetical protein